MGENEGAKPIRIKGSVKWKDYKKIVNPDTSEFERCLLVEKYIDGDVEEMDTRAVMEAFKRAMNEAANPNA